MSFVSGTFLIFFALLLLAYYLLPKKWQPYILLAASYVFYVFSGAKNLFYILLTTVTTYFGGILIGSYSKKRSEQMKALPEPLDLAGKKAWKKVTTNRKHWMVAAVLLINFGVLAYVKYFSYFAGLINNLITARGGTANLQAANILLPLGISFFTFQSVSYVIDVSNNKVEPQRNFFRYALFVSFFPQVVQGPIGRYNDLAGQLYSSHEFNLRQVKHGLILMLWGYFKKMVLADNLVGLVATLFDAGLQQKGLQVFFCGLIYSFQIYADFSGGIDVARGAAQMLGITMAQNFEQPFFAATLSEFWRRWHITLGAWTRDYVFYPLALSKTFGNLGRWGKKHIGETLGKVLPTCIVALINFLIIGIWHGANFRYIVYGLYNGIIIAIGTISEPYLARFYEKRGINAENKVLRAIRILRTIIIVSFGRIIARADSWNVSRQMLGNMFTQKADMRWIAWLTQNPMNKRILLIVALSIIVLLIRDVLVERGVKIYDIFDSWNVWVQALLIDLVILGILVFGVYGMGYSSSAFLYGGF